MGNRQKLLVVGYEKQQVASLRVSGRTTCARYMEDLFRYCLLPFAYCPQNPSPVRRSMSS
jgi:hypothetical protein